MNKKVITGFAVGMMMTLAMVGCGTQKTTQSAPAETTTQVEASAENWYQSVLEDQAVRDQYSFYRLADINLDGTDELFLSTTDNEFIGDEDKACLMVYDQGEAKTLQEIGGQGGEYWVLGQSDATLSHYSRLSGEGHIELYNLEDGELKEIGTADYYAQHHYIEEDNEEEVYLIDGEKVDSEEGESYFEQYGNRDGAVNFEAIQ